MEEDCSHRFSSASWEKNHNLQFFFHPDIFLRIITLVLQSHFCFLHLYSENKVMKPYFLFSYFLFFSPSSSEWLSKKLNELISLKFYFNCLFLSPLQSLGTLSPYSQVNTLNVAVNVVQVHPSELLSFRWAVCLFARLSPDLLCLSLLGLWQPRYKAKAVLQSRLHRLTNL